MAVTFTAAEEPYVYQYVSQTLLKATQDQVLLAFQRLVQGQSGPVINLLTGMKGYVDGLKSALDTTLATYDADVAAKKTVLQAEQTVLADLSTKIQTRIGQL